jgi:metal-responsive CopG/Arc/MetJ family transcriptional regulator
MKMVITSVQLDRDLVEKVKTIVKKKKPLRKINSYAEATREVLIDYVRKNQKILAEEINQTQIKIVQEEI